MRSGMNLQRQPLISVVTPVYNGEKFLEACVESVLAQTYQNWEYIIVNNCSTDGTLKIAQHYEEQDERIFIHNNTEFLGVIRNWNHALRQISAESKYCKVVHADDWLFPECIMQMVELAEANPSVGIVGAYRLDGVRVNLDTIACRTSPQRDGARHPTTVVPGREICRASLLGSRDVFGSPTSVLINSDIIRSCKSFYNESSLHADQEACYEVLQNSDFGFVHQVLTYTRRHEKSITSSFVSRFDTVTLEKINRMKKYGPIYLNSGEYEKRFKKKIDNYYRFLAWSVIQLREKQFWNYHKNELEKYGYSLDRAKLIRSLALEFFENPTWVVRRIIKALRNR